MPRFVTQARDFAGQQRYFGRMKLRRSVVVVIAWLIASVGCTNFREHLGDGEETQAAIKAQLGVDNAVGFNEFQGLDGHKLTVNVELRSTPSGDAKELKAKIEAIVRAHFHGSVDRVNVVL